MKKILIGALLMSLWGSVNAASMTFCDGIDENFEPIDAKETFVGKQFSIIAVADKPFNSIDVLVTVYQLQGGKSSVILRQSYAVDPSCNAFGLENATAPDYGTYKIAFSKPDGSDAIYGVVNLVEPKPDEPEPEIKPEKTRSQKMADLFNKYAK